MVAFEITPLTFIPGQKKSCGHVSHLHTYVAREGDAVFSHQESFAKGAIFLTSIEVTPSPSFLLSGKAEAEEAQMVV